MVQARNGERQAGRLQYVRGEDPVEGQFRTSEFRRRLGAMPLSDLSPEEFCSAKDIGRLHLGGYGNGFKMFHFRDCLIDMRTVFPIAPGGRACRKLFAQFEETKYDEIFSGQFLAQLPSPPRVDLERCFVLGGSPNYWHFVMDQLSTISLLTSLRVGATVPTVLLNDASPKGFLDLLNRAFELLELPPVRVGMTSKRFLRLQCPMHRVTASAV